MLDIIKNGLRNNDYYICLYPKHIYIYNYIEIKSELSDLILESLHISNDNRNYKSS